MHAHEPLGHHAILGEGKRDPGCAQAVPDEQPDHAQRGGDRHCVPEQGAQVAAGRARRVVPDRLRDVGKVPAARTRRVDAPGLERRVVDTVTVHDRADRLAVPGFRAPQKVAAVGTRPAVKSGDDRKDVRRDREDEDEDHGPRVCPTRVHDLVAGHGRQLEAHVVPHHHEQAESEGARERVLVDVLAAV